MVSFFLLSFLQFELCLVKFEFNLICSCYCFPSYSVIENNAALKTDIIPVTRDAACRDLRVSRVFHDVTLRGGISSGEFTDKGHVESIDECIAKCCSVDTCNLAFVIKDTCFAVKCKSYNDCGLKSAISEYYNPKIAYVNWSPPKDELDDTGIYICFRLIFSSYNNRLTHFSSVVHFI